MNEKYEQIARLIEVAHSNNLTTIQEIRWIKEAQKASFIRRLWEKVKQTSSDAAVKSYELSAKAINAIAAYFRKRFS